MIRTYLAAAAALLLTACGQSTAPTTEEPAPPQGLFEQVQAMSPETQPVFAYQQLAAYQQAHPELTPPCTAVRGTERINVPGNVDPTSIYAAHTNDAVFTVQCGALVSATRMDPNEKWLVSFAPGAAEAVVEHCLGERGADRCPRQVPTVEIAPTPTP
ncbi:hypothetical protein [Candidatus Viadribacter manganicus]|uniref:Uncharacterized protein n=1 Tax=Candidatus Viadribacter manganicus TaxID=1759059 RepID=A0A1B1AGC7_9PROT|nr:hypothetical protein [Candidatus Viadribacter manganicus]ANP45595.1 hypothetical protein ATE48_06515 [Candidatus Viadribacter manganicus]